MEITKNDLMLARDYIYELSQTILKLNTIYNQELSNRRIKYWINDKYLISYEFSSNKWHYLVIYDFDSELKIVTEEKKEKADLDKLFENLYKTIENDEWEKDE